MYDDDDDDDDDETLRSLSAIAKLFVTVL